MCIRDRSEEMGAIFAICVLLICLGCFIQFMMIAARMQAAVSYTHLDVYKRQVTDGMTSEDVLKASLKHLSFL